MTELSFGSCNYLFPKRQNIKSKIKNASKIPSFNLIKIYPGENKAEIAFMGGVDQTPLISTIIYSASEMSMASEKNETCDQDTLFPQITTLFPQLSTDEIIEQDKLFCCLPRLLVRKQS